MKVFTFFVQVFSIFAFLTLGSLLMIVGLHILSPEDALLRIQEIYSSPWKSVQTVMTGLLFITVGLSFAKSLLKKGKTDAVILQSELGPIVISVNAIEDTTRKVIKRFHLVKDCKINTEIKHKAVQIDMRLVLWAGGDVQELVSEIQQEARTRLRKLLGPDAKIDVTCDVHHIEDHEMDIQSLDRERAVAE
jgi:uncharacterized alkaline shock family protein YloU